jgi:hypothetical protein
MSDLDLVLREYDEAREAGRHTSTTPQLVASIARLISAADALADVVRWMANVQPPRVQQHQRGPDCRCEECRRDFPRQ